MSAQDQRLIEFLDFISRTVSASLKAFADIPPSMIRDALLAILTELGVNTAGIKTESDTIEIVITRGKKATEKES